MRRLIPLLALAVAPAALAAQVPANLETVELARSKDCVSILARLDALDRQLAPMAQRSQRLLAIAQAIAIEERAVVDSLDASDPIEAKVRDWFVADGQLAEQYAAQPTPELLDQRTAGRDAIKVTVTEALQAVQARADSAIAQTGNLQTEAGRCNGAVFVRSAVLEACQTTESPVCAAAAATDTAQSRPFRFVDAAEQIWDLQEVRPWTAPGPLQVSPNGQLGGIRTVGYTRTGNVVVTLAFTPSLQERSDLSPDEAERIRILTDSLGFGASHPDVVFVPALAIQASLPEPLGDETVYAFHFGAPDQPDIVWTVAAGSGAPPQGIVPLGPAHLAKLQAGDPITLTAVRQSEGGENEAVFSLELTSLNQAAAVQALSGYMAQQLASDLTRLIPPGDSQTPQ